MAEEKDYGFNVRSVQASAVWDFKAEKVPRLIQSHARINDSLFARYVRHHGTTVNRKGNSQNFVMMKFDYKPKDGEKSTKELRTDCYCDGVTIPWPIYDKDGKLIKKEEIKYHMLYRSAGKAKEGYCMFVQHDFQKKYRNYLTMGLWDKLLEEQAKIVELSAYAPLITATAIDFIKIPIDSIFVVRDVEVDSNRPTCTVRYGGGKCYVDHDESEKAKNTLWDGMGLADDSIFPEGINGFMYCRSHFFKSCLFRGNIQQWFYDYYGAEYETAIVTDMFGRKMMVKDIKVVLTDNSLKWLKFKDIMSATGTEAAAFKYWEKWMKKKDNDEMFQIVKTAHATKYDDGMQRSSFQINNTLLTTNRKVLQKIAQPSIDFCNSLKLNVDAYVRWLEIESTQRCSINRVLVDLYHQNPDVQNWTWWKDQRRTKISAFKRDRLLQGKLFQPGDNLTICGNPIALLMAVVGEDPIKEGCFYLEDDAIQCYTEQFAPREYIAGFRSPHNSPNNIVYLHNVYPNLIRLYFPKLGKNVIVINGICTDVQPRLSGQDLDSDAIFATNQPDIVTLAKKAYAEYPTIINAVKPETNKYGKNMESFVEMDKKISDGQMDVGYSSNMAQLALSEWFVRKGHLTHGKNRAAEDETEELDYTKDLEDIFIICSVLAQIAIDSAKRTFEVTVSNELRRIRESGYMSGMYPKFYAEVLKYKLSKSKDTDKNKKDKKEKIEKKTKFRKCPMDILYDIIECGVIDLRQKKTLNLLSNWKYADYVDFRIDTVKTDRKQYKKIIGIVEEYDKEIRELDMSKDTYAKDKEEKFNAMMLAMKNISKIQQDTMKSLVAYAFKSGNESIRNNMLIALYDKDRDKFLHCFRKKSTKNI